MSKVPKATNFQKLRGSVNNAICYRGVMAACGKGNLQVAIVAPSLNDLRAAWPKIASIPLNEDSIREVVMFEASECEESP